MPLDYKLDGTADAARRLVIPSGVHAIKAPKFPHERISDVPSCCRDASAVTGAAQVAFLVEPRAECPDYGTSLGNTLVRYARKLREHVR